MSKPELKPKPDNIPTKVSPDQRLSLQVNYRSPDAQNRPGSGRPRSISSAVPVIEEDKILDTSKAPRFERNNSTGSNINPYRKSSSSTTRTNNNGIVNGGFVDSRPPSIYGGSVNSLPVVREQYWFCSRWTKFERSLFSAVAILLGVIVVLAIFVGLLAAGRRPVTKTGIVL